MEMQECLQLRGQVLLFFLVQERGLRLELKVGPPGVHPEVYGKPLQEAAVEYSLEE